MRWTSSFASAVTAMSSWYASGPGVDLAVAVGALGNLALALDSGRGALEQLREQLHPAPLRSQLQQPLLQLRCALEAARELERPLRHVESRLLDLCAGQVDETLVELERVLGVRRIGAVGLVNELLDDSRLEGAAAGQLDEAKAIAAFGD